MRRRNGIAAKRRAEARQLPKKRGAYPPAVPDWPIGRVEGAAARFVRRLVIDAFSIHHRHRLTAL